jgi:hypothetical protein
MAEAIEAVCAPSVQKLNMQGAIHSVWELCDESCCTLTWLMPSRNRIEWIYAHRPLEVVSNQ